MIHGPGSRTELFEHQRLALAMLWDLFASHVRTLLLLQLLREEEVKSVVARARAENGPERVVLGGVVPLDAVWFVLVGDAIRSDGGSDQTLFDLYGRRRPYAVDGTPEPVWGNEAEEMLALDDVLEDVLACEVPELRVAAILALRA